jgi:hypothetical protein
MENELPLEEAPLDADELMNMADRIDSLPPEQAEWVMRLFQECLRSRTHEAELMSGQGAETAASESPTGQDLEAQLAQVALDTAEWLKTLWNVGYMGAASFPSQPRSAFPLVGLEDVLKSALFARIRQGKRPLPFPPPTRHGLPWHDLLDGQDETHAVSAEIVRDSQRQAIGAIVDGCTHWNIVEESEGGQQYIIQHHNKGPFFRLQLGANQSTLRREAPRGKRRIRRQERGGYQTYTLEWPQENGEFQNIPLRAANWDRAEAEADYWVATTHPELYGQLSFERVGTDVEADAGFGA